MTPKLLCSILAVYLAASAAAKLLHAETIRFPKENPAFTVEIPKDLTSEFNSNGTLSVMLSAKFSDTILFFREVPSNVRDDNSARNYLQREVDQYMQNFVAGLDAPKAPVPEEKQEISPNLKGFIVDGVFGGQKGTRGYETLSYSLAVFSFDSKRYFMMMTNGDQAAIWEKETLITKSITALK